MLFARVRRCFAKLPAYQKVGLPLLSPTMTKGTLTKWLKHEGEVIKPGNIIAEIETDKATVGFEATDDGFLAKILVAEGTADLAVGHPIAIFVDDLAAAQAFKTVSISELVGDTASAQPPQAAPAPTPTPVKVEETKVAAHDAGVRASPAAWAISEQHNLNLSKVHGTGVRGLVTKEDVLREISTQKPEQPAKPAAPQAAPAAKGIREIAPRFSLRTACTMDALLTLQKSLKDAGTAVTLEALLVKCAAAACQAVPYANSSYLPTATRLYEYVDVKLRQLTGKGGSVSYIRDAHVARVGDIQKQMVGGQADGQHCTFEVIACEDASTSTFQPDTSFVGFTQACNLTIGKTARTLLPPGSDGKLGTAQECTFVLNCDHRIVDGAVGAQWLQRFKAIVESPIEMI